MNIHCKRPHRIPIFRIQTIENDSVYLLQLITMPVTAHCVIDLFTCVPTSHIIVFCQTPHMVLLCCLTMCILHYFPCYCSLLCYTRCTLKLFAVFIYSHIKEGYAFNDHSPLGILYNSTWAIWRTTLKYYSLFLL